MNWKSWLCTLALTVVGWFVAPIIDATVKGSPLNGLPGIASYWRRVALHPLPVWTIGVVSLLAICAASAYVGMWKKHFLSKPDLRIVVLSTPQPRWGIGAMGTVPILNLSLHARLAHRLEGSIEIVSAYLKGTKCEAPFIPIIVTGAYDQSVMIHFGVRPIVPKDGKKMTRRIVLVDQFGNRHTSEPITFSPTVMETSRFRLGSTTLVCHFCRKPINLEDLSEASVVPAHKQCIT